MEIIRNSGLKVGGVGWLALLLGCAAPNKVVVTENYIQDYVNGASFTVFIEQSQVHINNQEDAAKILRDSAPRFLFHDMLTRIFVNQIPDKTAVGEATYYNQQNRSFLKKTKLSLGVGAISMFLPEKDEPLEEVTTDYILFLENIYTRTDRSLTRGRQEPIYYFVTQAEFAIWDTKYNEVVSYGEITAKSPNPFKEDLDEVQDDICESIIYEIFRQGPFVLKFDRVLPE